MLVYRDKKCGINHVKFISYSGRYPNLCDGTLVLEIDGKEYKFVTWGADNENTFLKFWSSGGGLDSNYNPYIGEWNIKVDMLPESIRQYAAEIDQVFNQNVEYGCCGGCA